MSLLSHAERHLARQARSECNSFISFANAQACRLAATSADRRAELGKPLSPIDGRLIAVKDNICTSDFPSTCASRILDGFVSPFEATVVARLRAAGAIVAGKTNLDEFGMGSHSTNSSYDPVRNPHSAAGEALSAGGSSGGSAAAVAAGECFAALGTDTGGSVRLPAAYCGVVGFKPSYGMLSRYGVVAYANSLDTVGIIGSTLGAVEEIFGSIDGSSAVSSTPWNRSYNDSHDPTCLRDTTRKRLEERRVTSASRSAIESQKIRIGVPEEYNIHEIDSAVREAWISTLQILQDQGHEIVPVSLPTTKLALSAYYILAPAEASSNLAKYDGVRYGRPSLESRDGADVLFARTRGEGLGAEVKRRILLGSFTLSSTAMDNYFIQAQRVRRLVQRDFNSVFSAPHPLLHSQASAASADGVDVLLTPTAPTRAPTLRDVADRTPTDGYRDDVFTVPASLAGLPAISVPVEPVQLGSTPIGMQLIGQFGDDLRVLRLAGALEKILGRISLDSRSDSLKS